MACVFTACAQGGLPLAEIKLIFPAWMSLCYRQIILGWFTKTASSRVQDVNLCFTARGQRFTLVGKWRIRDCLLVLIWGIGEEMKLMPDLKVYKCVFFMVLVWIITCLWCLRNEFSGCKQLCSHAWFYIANRRFGVWIPAVPEVVFNLSPFTLISRR